MRRVLVSLAVAGALSGLVPLPSGCTQASASHDYSIATEPSHRGTATAGNLDRNG